MEYTRPSAEELSLIQRLLSARAAWSPSGERTLIVVRGRDAAPIVAWCSRVGFLTAVEATGPLEEIALRHAATRAVALNAEVFDAIVAAWNSAPTFAEALIAASVALLQAQQNETLEAWPSVDALTGVIFETADRISFGTWWPEGQVVALILWQRGQVSSTVVLRRHGHSVDAVAGSETVRQWAGPLSGVLRRDSFYIAQALERELGPLQIGVFIDVDALQKHERSDAAHSRVAWSSAWQAGDIVIEAKWPWSWLLQAGLAFQGLREFAQAQFGQWLALLNVPSSVASPANPPVNASAPAPTSTTSASRAESAVPAAYTNTPTQ